MAKPPGKTTKNAASHTLEVLSYTRQFLAHRRRQHLVSQKHHPGSMLQLSDVTSRPHLLTHDASFTIVGFGSLVARGRCVFIAQVLTTSWSLFVTDFSQRIAELCLQKLSSCSRIWLAARVQHGACWKHAPYGNLALHW